MKYVSLIALCLMFTSCGKFQGEPGKPGTQGPAGNPGSVGKDGLTGPQGPKGEDGQDLTPITVVDPCPGITAAYPEIFFRIDGKLYAVYADGQKIHLVLLTAGNYRTTDGRNCSFAIDANGDIVI